MKIKETKSAFGAAQCFAAVSLLLGADLAAPVQAEDWDVYWKNGTRVESEDGDVALKFGGRIQADFSSVSGDDGVDAAFDLEGGNEFRRARLFFEGTLYERFEFKAQYDFVGGAEVKDLWIGITDLPVIGGIRVGHQKEPFGLEQLTSSKYIAFLERSLTDEFFTAGRNTGILFKNALQDDRVTWAAGLFRPSDDSGQSLDDVWNLTARITGLPVYADEGRRLFHLGLGLSDRSAADGELRFRARPEAHLSPRFVDTGTLAAEDAMLLGLELAFVEGSFWLAAEAMQASVSQTAAPDADLSGYNVQAGFFLTGEHRPFKTSTASWDRLQPDADFQKGGGGGAWEIAGRISSLDGNDASIRAGEIDSVALALNWYPNSAFRAMLNYVRAELQDVGDADFVLLRFQVDF